MRHWAEPLTSVLDIWKKRMPCRHCWSWWMRGGIVRSWRWNKTAAASRSERCLSEAANWGGGICREQSFGAAICLPSPLLFCGHPQGASLRLRWDIFNVGWSVMVELLRKSVTVLQQRESYCVRTNWKNWKNRKKPVNHVGCGLVSGKLNYAIIMRGWPCRCACSECKRKRAWERHLRRPWRASHWASKCGWNVCESEKPECQRIRPFRRIRILPFWSTSWKNIYCKNSFYIITEP